MAGDQGVRWRAGCMHVGEERGETEESGESAERRAGRRAGAMLYGGSGVLELCTLDCVCVCAAAAVRVSRARAASVRTADISSPDARIYLGAKACTVRTRVFLHL